MSEGRKSVTSVKNEILDKVIRKSILKIFLLS